ncbi:MAG: anti-sigma factor domain-containing protein [Chloroflexota bacterium]
MTPDEIAEMLGAYALDALSPEERAAVEAYLPTAPPVEEEATRLSSVAALLPLSVEPRDPPPALRTRLLTIVEQEEAEWKQAHAGTSQPTDVPIALPTPPSRVEANWGTLLRLRLRGLPAYAYGAGGAVVAAAAVLLIVLLNRNGVTVVTHRGSAVAQVVGGVKLSGATFTVDTRSDHTTAVHFTNLPAPPTGKAYEIWLIPAKGQPVPVGGFVPRSNHSFSAIYHHDARGFAAAAVSIERAPGNASVPSHDLAFEAKLTG